MPSSDEIVLPAWAAGFAATFERVGHHLELSEGFVLLPVELPDSMTAKLLAEWLNGRGLACHYIDINGVVKPRPLLERLLAVPEQATASLLFVDKMSDWLPGALQLLNQQRDVLARRHPRPLLWCAPARFLDLTWVSAPDLWSIAAVPIRLPAPMMRSASDPTAAIDRHVALYRMLLDMYSVDDLLRLVRYQFGPEVSAELREKVSAPALVYDLLQVLERRGLIDHNFFARLRSERPRRYPEIEAVARLWTDQERPTRSMGSASTWMPAIDAALQGNQIIFLVCHDLRRLKQTIEDVADRLREDYRVRSVPLRSMHDEESAWTAPPSEHSGGSRKTGPPEITFIVDAEGQPLGEPDHEQLNAIRQLLNRARPGPSRRGTFHLFIPLVGTRSAAEATARSLSGAIRPTGLLVHILELDALAKPL